MSRPLICFTAILILNANAAGAQTSIKSTAPQKMMSPAEARKMHACEAQAAQKKIKMTDRSKFVMDCMTATVQQGAS
jgi:hypothetical protein